jgi:hypothetical protein
MAPMSLSSTSCVLDTAAHHADGDRLPKFVEQEFRDFLACGVLAHGFARLRCGDCAFERLVPLSCKGRGFCPSCGGRRMTESAARLVNGVLPRVPVRQWVLSLPHRLRYLLAWDHTLCRAVLAVYARVLLSFQRRRARGRGLRGGHSGCVTVIQRFGGGLNLNVHFHTLVLDGVFTEGEGGTLHFRPLPPPTDEEVGVVLAAIYPRVGRLLCRRGFAPGDAEISAPDPVAEASPMLAGISSASIQGRIALGPRAGARVWRVGRSWTRRGCCRAARGTRTLPASISTRMPPCRPPTARAWNSSVAICCARAWRRTDCGAWATTASCLR